MMGAGHGRPTNETFAEVARALLAEKDVQHTLQRIVDLAVETIDGCDHAGITFRRDSKMSTPAASNDVPGQVDAIQYETGEGPCLDAIREHEVFATGDLGAETRWPKFSRRAHEETGVTSMLCFRLFVDGDTLGALNLYSKAVDAFDDEARAVGLVFAAHAAVALSSALHDEQMHEALRSRDVIGQAKGILMAREGLTADQAFDMLRRASQRLNVKLRELAEEIAYTGEPPGSPPAAAAAAGEGEGGA
jgi:transcriptional regulator with GAF, ATPase, and Fis domain